MLPYLKEDVVVIPDRKLASTLINKGSYGKPISGGSSELSLLEAAYLLECDRLEVKRSRKGRKASHHDLLASGISSRSRFMEDYLVFRDMRNRGINIQGGGNRTFMSYPRGQGPRKGRADSWIMVFREHDPVTILELLQESMKRTGMRMDLLSAVVDGDWDLTYYQVKGPLFDINGSIDHDILTIKEDHHREIPGGGMLAWEGELVSFARKEGMGSDIHDTLALSSQEANWLTGSGDVEDRSMKDAVYSDLVNRGYLVKTGFKYGSHFRAYSSGSIEEHSDLLVHCVEPDQKFTWEELSRAIRLSHSVKKRMLFAMHEKRTGVRYLEIEWTRP